VSIILASTDGREQIVFDHSITGQFFSERRAAGIAKCKLGFITRHRVLVVSKRK